VKPAQEQQNVVYTSPIGYWKQIDDRTQQLQSILHIYDKDGRLYGKVLKTYTVNGVPPDVRCTKCKDELYNKEIIGLVVLSGFQQKTDVKWSGGQILDPKSGKIYQSNLTLTNNGNTLIVRGYVGISMLGRSQTWYRTTKPK
jgi:uncharacterized protein (DUF2147 family)